MTNTGTELGKGTLVAEGKVKPEWIDVNGHMNVAYYLLAFDQGVDALWTEVGITDEYIKTRKLSTFAVEAHITYQQELHEGDLYRVTDRFSLSITSACTSFNVCTMRKQAHLQQPVSG